MLILLCFITALLILKNRATSLAKKIGRPELYLFYSEKLRKEDKKRWIFNRLFIAFLIFLGLYLAAGLLWITLYIVAGFAASEVNPSASQLLSDMMIYPKILIALLVAAYLMTLVKIIFLIRKERQIHEKIKIYQGQAIPSERKTKQTSSLIDNQNSNQQPTAEELPSDSEISTVVKLAKVRIKTTFITVTAIVMLIIVLVGAKIITRYVQEEERRLETIANEYGSDNSANYIFHNDRIYVYEPSGSYFYSTNLEGKDYQELADNGHVTDIMVYVVYEDELYYFDSWNNGISKINLSTGEIKEVIYGKTLYLFPETLRNGAILVSDANENDYEYYAKLNLKTGEFYDEQYLEKGYYYYDEDTDKFRKQSENFYLEDFSLIGSFDHYAVNKALGWTRFQTLNTVALLQKEDGIYLLDKLDASDPKKLFNDCNATSARKYGNYFLVQCYDKTIIYDITQAKTEIISDSINYTVENNTIYLMIGQDLDEVNGIRKYWVEKRTL